MKMILLQAVLVSALVVPRSCGVKETESYNPETENILINYTMCKKYVTHAQHLSLNCSRKSLQRLTFSENIDTIELTLLDLSENLLVKIEAGRLSPFSRLQTLNLSGNSIKEVETGAFDNLTTLEKLDISSNAMETLPTDLFVNLTELMFLDLSKNQLKQLPNKLPMLEWFDVSSNLISVLHEDLDSLVLYPQQVFLIGENPLTCDCEMLWCKEFLDTRKYLLNFAKHIERNKFFPKCAKPAHLRGREWDTLDDDEFKCSGLVDNTFKSTNENEENNFKVDESDSVIVDAIGPTSIIIKWTDFQNFAGATSIEIKYHRFGKKKSMKSVILPLEAQSYRLKRLNSNSPYVICYNILSGNQVTDHDCLEVVTSKSIDESMSPFSRLLVYLSTMLDNYSTVILISVIVILFSALITIHILDIK